MDKEGMKRGSAINLHNFGHSQHLNFSKCPTLQEMPFSHTKGTGLSSKSGAGRHSLRMPKQKGICRSLTSV